MSKRQEYRQHSKSTLLKATEILFRERREVEAIIARKWRRRLIAAAAAALVLGAAAGSALTLVLR